MKLNNANYISRCYLNCQTFTSKIRTTHVLILVKISQLSFQFLESFLHVQSLKWVKSIFWNIAESVIMLFLTMCLKTVDTKILITRSLTIGHILIPVNSDM